MNTILCSCMLMPIPRRLILWQHLYCVVCVYNNWLDRSVMLSLGGKGVIILKKDKLKRANVSRIASIFLPSYYVKYRHTARCNTVNTR